METFQPINQEPLTQASFDKAPGPVPELQDPFYAELQRAESLQEKSVKEAKTKCRTIASLLTAAPNPHSKGVLMFKKRRQRAKKYTLVSFGAAAGTGTEEEEDGVPPTSESELDDEAFSDARSLTNQSDWDSPYLDMELARVGSGAAEGQGSGQGGHLSEVSGRGVQLFEQQRQRAASSTLEPAQVGPAAELNGQGLQSPPRAQSAPPEAAVLPPSPSPAPVASPRPFPLGGGASSPSPSIFNRSARPFTPGLQGQRPGTTSVIFRPSAPKRANESIGSLSPVPPPFASPPSSFAPPAGSPGAARSPGPVTATSSLYIPAPSRPVTPGAASEHSAPPGAMTSTASIFLSSPLRASARPGSPAPAPAAPEGPSAREQRISVPAARTGILQEARRRGTRKQMFGPGKEETKNSPNPELLSLVQNLDEKPPAGGAESGPEEDALSLGAEACNFMQPPGGRGYKTPPHVTPKTPPPVAPKTPPPVAPKPASRGLPDGLVNGATPAAGIPEPPRLLGRGGELFAKRQSRADRYVVEATPGAGFGPGPRPRSPSPTPSLPPSWKYSPNIRAPPPIAYNPLLSPFFPQAARTLPKAQSQGPRATPKQGIKALDFMRHQPYQLKTAMFCFDEIPPTPNPTSGPTKTVRVQEIRRFSTPAPQPTAEPLVPTVLAPRAATTLDEPIWRAELASAPILSPAPPQESPRRLGATPNSCGFQVARPRFSATRTGLQAHVWRPGAGHK
ncbi:synaptopodin 2-like protein isoform 1-T1 [Thomomys bottae]